MRVTLEAARSWWTRKQGLAAPQEGPLEDVVARTGWLRTLGGADVYLALRARVPGTPRKDLDAACEAHRLQVLPAVRSCIYLVPRAHAALALRQAESTWRPRTERELEKAGARWTEVEATARAVHDTLAAGPLTTDALRRALPGGAVRSLGEAGKKVGISSTLPPALRALELQGLVERTLEGGRLDTERYLWRRSKESAFAGASLPAEGVDLVARLLTIFLSQTGPVTLRHFAEWAGVSLTDARKALGRVPARAMAVEGYADDALILEDEAAATASVPPVSGPVLLAFEDNLLTAHGGPGVHVPQGHGARPVDIWGMGSARPLDKARHVAQRTLLVDGKLAGFWEYDPDAREVVVAPFDPLPAKVRKRLDALATETARFLGEEVGHARSFSLDTDEQVRERARALRKAAGR